MMWKLPAMLWQLSRVFSLIDGIILFKHKFTSKMYNQCQVHNTNFFTFVQISKTGYRYVS